MCTHRQINIHIHRRSPINKSLVLWGQVESSTGDTSSVPRDQSVARGNLCVCSLSLSRLKHCTQIRLHSSGTSLKRFFTQEHKSDLVSASGAACFTLSNRRQWGMEGLWGCGEDGVGGVGSYQQKHGSGRSSLRERMCWLTGHFSQAIWKCWTSSGDPDS